MSKSDDDQRQWLQIPTRAYQAQPGQRQQSSEQPASIEAARPAPSHDASRPAAANVARTQLDHIYDTDPPHQTEKTPATTATGQHIPETYNRQHTDVSQHDWHQYHAAWQQYYQQYYQRYYLQQIHLQRQGKLSTHASNAAAPHHEEKKAEQHAAAETPTEKLQHEVVGKVRERAKKARASHHFMPILTALAVGGLFFMMQFNKVIAAQVNSYVSPSQTVSDRVIVDPNASPVVGNESRLIIPKINVDVPIVYGLESLDNASTQKALEDGVAHYPLNGANSLPGQTGNHVILGHSSNDVFAPGDYKFAFVLLERLEAGDLFYVHYEGKRYVYEVTAKEVILPSEVNELIKPYDKPLTTLVTCTPIGTDDKRLLVTAEQISPDPSKAEQLEAPTGGNQDVKLPGNEPSLLQGLFNL